MSADTQSLHLFLGRPRDALPATSICLTAFGHISLGWRSKWPYQRSLPVRKVLSRSLIPRILCMSDILARSVIFFLQIHLTIALSAVTNLALSTTAMRLWSTRGRNQTIVPRTKSSAPFRGGPDIPTHGGGIRIRRKKTTQWRRSATDQGQSAKRYSTAPTSFVIITHLTTTTAVWFRKLSPFPHNTQHPNIMHPPATSCPVHRPQTCNTGTPINHTHTPLCTKDAPTINTHARTTGYLVHHQDTKPQGMHSPPTYFPFHRILHATPTTSNLPSTTAYPPICIHQQHRALSTGPNMHNWDPKHSFAALSSTQDAPTTNTPARTTGNYVHHQDPESHGMHSPSPYNPFHRYQHAAHKSRTTHTGFCAAEVPAQSTTSAALCF